MFTIFNVQDGGRARQHTPKPHPSKRLSETAAFRAATRCLCLPSDAVIEGNPSLAEHRIAVVDGSVAGALLNPARPGKSPEATNPCTPVARITIATALHEWRIMVSSRWAHESKCNHPNALRCLTELTTGHPPYPSIVSTWCPPELVWVLVCQFEPSHSPLQRLGCLHLRLREEPTSSMLALS